MSSFHLPDFLPNFAAAAPARDPPPAFSASPAHAADWALDFYADSPLTQPNFGYLPAHQLQYIAWMQAVLSSLVVPQPPMLNVDDMNYAFSLSDSMQWTQDTALSALSEACSSSVWPTNDLPAHIDDIPAPNVNEMLAEYFCATSPVESSNSSDTPDWLSVVEPERNEININKTSQDSETSPPPHPGAVLLPSTRSTGEPEEDAFLVVGCASNKAEQDGVPAMVQGARSQAAMTKQLYKSLRLRLFPKASGTISRVTQLQAAIDRIDALESEVVQLRAAVGCTSRQQNMTGEARNVANQAFSKGKAWIQYTP